MISSTKKKHIVGIADMKVSADPNDLIITHSLGSCLGVVLYDPVEVVAGLLHCMLPISKSDKAKAEERPLMFTDTGVLSLLQAMFDAGAKKENLIAKAAGGATIMDKTGMFKIGERNFTVLRKVLWKNDIVLKRKDVGGTQPRTVTLHVDTGKTIIRSGGEEWPL